MHFAKLQLTRWSAGPTSEVASLGKFGIALAPARQAKLEVKGMRRKRCSATVLCTIRATCQGRSIESACGDDLIRWIVWLDVEITEKDVGGISIVFGELLHGISDEMGVHDHHVKVPVNAWHVVHANRKGLVAVVTAEEGKNGTVEATRDVLAWGLFGSPTRGRFDKAGLGCCQLQNGLVNRPEWQHVDQAQSQILGLGSKRVLGSFLCSLFFFVQLISKRDHCRCRDDEVQGLHGVQANRDGEGHTHVPVECIAIERWDEFVAFTLEKAVELAAPTEWNFLQTDDSLGSAHGKRNKKQNITQQQSVTLTVAA